MSSTHTQAGILGGPWRSVVSVRTLSGDSLSAQNDFDSPCAVCPVNGTATMAKGELVYDLVPFSFTVFTFQRQ